MTSAPSTLVISVPQGSSRLIDRVVGDTGSHVFSFMDYLVGPVDEVVAHCPVVHKNRPDVSG